MATLDSTSTLSEILAAYADNASYAEDGSATKARSFITACRLLLINLPRRTSAGGKGGEEIELDPRMIQEEMQAAQRWLVTDPVATSADGGGLRFASFQDFRD
jgi:hypothetical protein